MTGIQWAMFTLPIPPANPVMWDEQPPEEPDGGGNGGNGNGETRHQPQRSESQRGGKR